jgi:hypothetical protein
MEENMQSWQRFRTLILLAFIFFLFIFPIFTNRGTLDSLGGPEVTYIPNTDKIQVTLFPTKKVNGMRVYSLLPASERTRTSEYPYQIVPGNIPNAIAFCSYFAENGAYSGVYRRLVLRSDDSHASGYLEGYLTAELIFEFFTTVITDLLPTFLPSVSVEKLRQWFSLYAEQLQVALREYKKTTTFWSGLYWQWRRLEGLHQGYNAYAQPSHKLSLGDFVLLNSLWEIRSVAQFADAWKPKKWDSLSAHELWRDVVLQTFGSTFVTKKTTGRLQHVHVMLLPFEKEKFRLGKVYRDLFLDTHTATFLKREISLVSYPGIIANVDTFLLVPNVSLVARNPFASERLRRDISSSRDFPSNCSISLLSFLRLSTASLLATSALEWVQFYTHCAAPFSGSASIIVTDVRSLPTTSRHGQFEGRVLLLEEMGPTVFISDITDELQRKGWVMSSCRPHHPVLLQLSGWAQLTPQRTQTLCPSAIPLSAKPSGLYNLVEDVRALVMSPVFEQNLQLLQHETKWNVDVVEEGLTTDEF